MKQTMIGILAGMGPRSTAPFIDMVVTQCQNQYGARDDIDFPKMMICSQPAPFYEDRPTEHEALEAAILEGLLDLENAGADFLAIACNTAHIYYPQLASKLSVPLLNMMTLAVERIPASVGKIALVAAQPTAEAEIYQQAIRQAGLEIVPIDYQHDINELLAATRNSRDGAVFTQLWDAILKKIELSGAGLVLVACLDLSAVIPYAKSALPLLDASEALAEEIVKQWLSRRQ